MKRRNCPQVRRCCNGSMFVRVAPAFQNTLLFLITGGNLNE